ncbi:MAG: acetamidase/formamidase family protein, partial [Actinomycetes bacterium]
MHHGEDAARTLASGLGRRRFLQAAAGVGAGTALTVGTGLSAAATPGGRTASAATRGKPTAFGGVLQPGKGRIRGDHYLRSDVDEVLWGYVPSVHATPVTRIRSGRTITIDSVSHEGILEDQGRDPVGFFAQHDVRRREVLDDAVAIASGYDRTERSF